MTIWRERLSLVSAGGGLCGGGSVKGWALCALAAALLSSGCAPCATSGISGAHRDGLAGTPSKAVHDATLPEVAAAEPAKPLFQSFFFVYQFEGQLYVQVSNELAEPEARNAASSPVPALDGPVKFLESGIILSGAAEEPLPDPELLLSDGAIVLSTALGQGPVGPSVLAGVPTKWEIYQGGTLLCTGSPVEFLEIGMLVPHFGQTQGWDAEPETSPEKSAETRRQLMSQASKHVMFRVGGCDFGNTEVNWPDRLWGRPAGGRPARVTDFYHVPPEETAKTLMGRTKASPMWTELAKKVNDAYGQEAPEQEVPATEYIRYGVLVGPPGASTELLLVRPGLGEAMCGQGPSEAFLGQLWARTGDAEWTSVLLFPEDPEKGVVGAEPLLYGDFNGDGKFEAVFRTGLFQDERVLFQWDDSGERTVIRRTFLNYMDCPC